MHLPLLSLFNSSTSKSDSLLRPTEKLGSIQQVTVHKATKCENVSVRANTYRGYLGVFLLVFESD